MSYLKTTKYVSNQGLKLWHKNLFVANLQQTRDRVNKKLNLIVTAIFVRGRKLNISLVFIT